MPRKRSKKTILSADEIADIGCNTLAILHRRVASTRTQSATRLVEDLLAKRDREWLSIVASIVRAHATELQSIVDRLEPGALADMVQALIDNTDRELAQLPLQLPTGEAP